MNFNTGVKYVPQTKVNNIFEGVYDWEIKDYKSFPNQYEAQGYLNRFFNKEVETRILRVIVEVV